MEVSGDAMLMNNAAYLAVVEQVKQRIAAARYQAQRAVNSELVMLFWDVGTTINDHATWGSGFVKNLARDIKLAYPKVRGFSARNLTYMATFARLYPSVEVAQTVSAQLSWSHITLMLDKVPDQPRRDWYTAQAVENHWSVRRLESSILDEIYERQALPHKATNFAERLPAPQDELARDSLRDPYVFDFIEYRHGMVERDIEDALVAHVVELLLELGTGFAFVGQQYPLVVGGEEFAVDLLFYHLKLRCYVVIELKNRRFRPEHIGQLNFYVSAVDELLATDRDNPTIGLLLCRTKNTLVAEYSLRDINKPIGVSEFRVFETLPPEYEALLPSAADIESRLVLPTDDKDEPDEGEDSGDVSPKSEEGDQIWR